jgi:hypothetical protein
VFNVFGDESVDKSTVVYGAIAIPACQNEAINDAINALKVRFGVSNQAKFHSRIVFHADARKKSGWRNLNNDQVFEFADAFTNFIRAQIPVLSVGAVHRSEYPSIFHAGAGLPESIMDTKQLTAIVFQAAMIPIIERLGPSNIQLWVDPDKTKIPWFGKNMRADRNYKAVIAGAGSQSHIEPQEIGAIPPVLLEAADLFAYVSAHALSPDAGRYQSRFEALYQKYRPLLTVFTYDPEKRLKYQISRPILELKHARICQANPNRKDSFHKLPVGACIWMQGYNRDGQIYPCVLMKVPSGHAQKAMASGTVDIRATIRMVGTIAVPCVLFRLRDDATIYGTFLNHKAAADNSPLTQLSEGKDLRLVLFEDAPEPVGEISYKDLDTRSWKELIAAIAKFPVTNESDFWSAINNLGLSPQELWDSI